MKRISRDEREARRWDRFHEKRDRLDKKTSEFNSKPLDEKKKILNLLVKPNL